ncbi:TetR/AcrR family transcriptional regulator [Yinghuangia seranimata]|uniref:TetR/AcrR family transcriptional regulator n=1 Tax=Yinghuangia seranimata TaxID=408067 RepID=UPI00248C8EAD|nr:TetR family transcriptional regulator [Yinghuangia seranimata]MDI2127654.1 TetR family transcriptional regulator [Yinghuangia seranimata]
MPTKTEATPARRRQARGEARAAHLLEAASEVFADVGYAAATTNAIAARAKASPGTLYQFFPNKEAMASALAERYLAQLDDDYAFVADADLAALPLDALLDRIIDPMIRFNVANPAFKALFAGPATPGHLAESAERLHTAVHAWVDAVLTAIAPALPPRERQRAATVTVHVVRALLPVIIAARGSERTAMTAELKKALLGYLTPLDARPAPDA